MGEAKLFPTVVCSFGKGLIHLLSLQDKSTFSDATILTRGDSLGHQLQQNQALCEPYASHDVNSKPFSKTVFRVLYMFFINLKIWPVTLSCLTHSFQLTDRLSHGRKQKRNIFPLG